MLNKEIKTIEDAKDFLKYLIKNDLMFHLDDKPSDILWEMGTDTPPDVGLLCERYNELWGLGNPWEYAEDIIDSYLQGIQDRIQ